MARSKRPTFHDDVTTATGGEVRRFLPSHIRTDHSANQRWSPYDSPTEIAKWIGAKCCFTLATIEERLESLMREGQLTPIEVSMSGTGYPDLEMGFLRHCAFLLAEARGCLDKIPGAKGNSFAGIKALVVAAPKSQADHADKNRRNREENIARVKLSPVDHALYFTRRLAALRDDGSTMTVEELAAEEGCGVDHVNRHLRLFKCLKPEQLLEVHEGKVTMSAALKAASASGAGTTTGPRGGNPGIRTSAIRRALKAADTRKRPTTSLLASQIEQLFVRVSGADEVGVVDESTETDPDVEAWAEWLDADKSVGKAAATPKKKAPKKQGTKAAPADDAEA